ncbi:MAG: hypothetical protein KME29_16830 [Calothrix sp. FI2-JRJ7]|jgi:SpoVK/Ycf46/Vps4 family AAA+-type ATPase|nr:hypothetical protein [Calothrix sp. FI2-JRJ7]
MWEDEILEEIHRIREEHAKAFNYDIKAICEDCFYTEFKSDADKQSIYGAIQSSFFVPLKPNF